MIYKSIEIDFVPYDRTDSSESPRQEPERRDAKRLSKWNETCYPNNKIITGILNNNGKEPTTVI
jgi:hypothetical protein